MLLIDHQVGTMGWVRSVSAAELKRNALLLAKVAKILKMPVVLTSSMEEYTQGPLFPELVEVLPEAYAARVKRFGIVDAMDDPHFAAAVKGTGRKNLIIAGVTNDVCVVYPALRALKEGYSVQVVADAGGSPTKFADEISLRRMEQAGVVLTSAIQLAAELAANWTSPEGGEIMGAVIGVLNEVLQSA
jgi:nicotinamidase-related amidase